MCDFDCLKRKRVEERCDGVKLPPFANRKCGYMKTGSISATLSTAEFSAGGTTELPDIVPDGTSGMILWMPTVGIYNMRTFFPVTAGLLVANSVVSGGATGITWIAGTAGVTTVSFVCAADWPVAMCNSRQLSIGPNIVDNKTLVSGRSVAGEIRAWCDTTTVTSVSLSGSFTAYDMLPYEGYTTTADLKQYSTRCCEPPYNKGVKVRQEGDVSKLMRPVNYPDDRTYSLRFGRLLNTYDVKWLASGVPAVIFVSPWLSMTYTQAGIVSTSYLTQRINPASHLAYRIFLKDTVAPASSLQILAQDIWVRQDTLGGIPKKNLQMFATPVSVPRNSTITNYAGTFWEYIPLTPLQATLSASGGEVTGVRDLMNWTYGGTMFHETTTSAGVGSISVYESSEITQEPARLIKWKGLPRGVNVEVVGEVIIDHIPVSTLAVNELQVGRMEKGEWESFLAGRRDEIGEVE